MRNNSYIYGIPHFNISDKFTYFIDLTNINYNSPIVALQKKHLYENARNEAEKITSLLKNDNATEIQSAIKFLGVAAQNERKKEILILKAYKAKLQKELPRGKDIDKILSSLDSANLNNPKQLNQFYNDLTSCLNILRQNAEDYYTRLQQWKKHNNKKMNELAQDDYRFRAAGDIQAILNNITGMATKAQEKKVESFAAKLRELVANYIIDNNVSHLCATGEDFAAIVAAITLDIEKELQKELDKDTEKNDFSELTDKELQNFINEYSSRTLAQQTRLQKALTADQDSLQDILYAAKNILGITTLSGSAKATQITKANSRTSKMNERNSMFKFFKNSKKIDYNLLQELKAVKFSSTTKTSHGNLFELIQVLTNQNAIKIGGSAATDTISMGSVDIELENTDIGREIKQWRNEIANAYTEYDMLKRESREQDRTEAFLEMNKEVEKAEEEINKLLEKLDIQVNDLFIYHESLKLYMGMETNDSDAFHGREMIILNYIDELYSLAGIGDLVLPQKDALIFLALNLSNEAVGAGAKNTLAHYLSIFAGLLMFDDVRNIAIEAARKVNSEQSKTLKNIHLYNLNGIYVPASMILTYTYQSLQQAYDQIISGRGAKVNISTNKIDKDINVFLNTEDKISEYNVSSYRYLWPIMADKASSGTTVRIAFLAAFNQFINELLG